MRPQETIDVHSNQKAPGNPQSNTQTHADSGEDQPFSGSAPDSDVKSDQIDMENDTLDHNQENEEPTGSEEVPDSQVDELATLKQEAEESRAQYLRTLADLENFRRRSEKEKSEARKFANEGVMKQLLPVMDSFEKALLSEQGELQDLNSLKEGIQLIYKQLEAALSQNGLEAIEAEGLAFDPNFHQAIQKVESADESVEVETVQQEFVKGYMLNGRLLRATMVSVAIPKETKK